MVMFLSVALTLHYGLPESNQSSELLGPTDYVASPLPAGNGRRRFLTCDRSCEPFQRLSPIQKTPYRLLYGGQRVKDLSAHPDKCVRIVNGPNVDDCTTAAGRYQFFDDDLGVRGKKVSSRSACMV